MASFGSCDLAHRGAICRRSSAPIRLATIASFAGVGLAYLVRAFNTLSYTIFVREANRPDPKLAIPIAGDDGEALVVAAGLVRDAGSSQSLWASLWMRAGSNVGAPGYGQS